jgi:hypothetical protein
MAEKEYSICVGPIALPIEGSYQILKPAEVHIVKGSAIKIQLGDTSFFQIVDTHGAVKFSTPSHMVVWCKATESAAPVVLAAAEPISIKTVLAVKPRRKQKDDGRPT